MNKKLFMRVSICVILSVIIYAGSASPQSELKEVDPQFASSCRIIARFGWLNPTFKRDLQENFFDALHKEGPLIKPDGLEEAEISFFDYCEKTQGSPKLYCTFAYTALFQSGQRCFKLDPHSYLFAVQGCSEIAEK